MKKANNNTKNTNKKGWSKKKKIIVISSIITAFLLVVATSVTIPLVVYNTHAATVQPEKDVYEVKFDEGNASAKLYLNNKPVEVEGHEVVANVTNTVTKTATCEEAGAIEYTATVYYNGSTFTNKVTKTLSALGHKPAEAIRENELEATCESDGHYDLVVKCSTCGKELSRETITIDKLGHVYAFDHFEWSEDYEQCSAVFVCKANAEHTRNVELTVNKTTVEATCEADGSITYSVEYNVDTTVYSDTKVKPLEKLGHDYRFSKFVVNDDLTHAEAMFVCMNDLSHVDMREATITHETTLAPTCHDDGIETYTIIYGEYIETREVVLEALGHDFIDAYESDNIHVQTCSRCDAERLEYKNENGNTTTNTVVLYDSEE